MRLYRLFFTFAISLAFASCNKPITIAPATGDDEIRSEQKIQQRMVDDINAQGGQPKRWKNHKNMRGQFESVGEKIEKAGAEVCRGMHLEKNGCYYYFRMSRDEEVNSKADGKNIVIFTGMMRFVESDDELAVVMGHEFTHNLMHHNKSQEHNATWGMLIGAVGDELANIHGINTDWEIASAGAEIGALTYGSDFEREADYIGLYVMARAGYDIKKAPLLWRRMSVEDPEGIYNSVTHPSNAERFISLQKTISEIEFKRKNHIPLLPDLKAE
jgi:predicted Zn-dependent protease